MKPGIVGIGVAVGLTLSACSGAPDPYYEALEDVGWDVGPLGEGERADLYEAMAADVCGTVHDLFLAGEDEATVAAEALHLIDPVNPDSDHAWGALNAMLDYRCDPESPDGLKR